MSVTGVSERKQCKEMRVLYINIDENTLAKVA